MLKILEMGSKLEPRILWDEGRDVFWGFLSPDKRWLLFGSPKLGVSQICVKPWPNVSLPEKQISTQGGTDPLWGKDGKELFYRNGDQYMRVAVPDSLYSWIPEPKLMFTGNYLNVAFKSWDVLDEQHFIMIQPTHPDPPETELYLIRNWFEKLKRQVPIK